MTDLLFAQLAAEPSLVLVDRADIAKLLAEQEVSLSGLVNPQQATKVGQLTGAKLLITGSVLQVDNTVYLIAKIIGTETSRVVGASVKGNVRDDLVRWPPSWPRRSRKRWPSGPTIWWPSRSRRRTASRP